MIRIILFFFHLHRLSFRRRCCPCYGRKKNWMMMMGVIADVTARYLRMDG